MGLFNDAGLITQGFGRNQRLVTQGYGSSFEFGGIRPTIRKLKEYDVNIFTPVLRENYSEIGIYSPLEIKKDGEISLSSNVYKEIEKDLNLFTGINHNKLSEILDAI